MYDDSDADLDFYPNDINGTPNKLARFFPTDNEPSSDDEEEVVSPSSNILSWSKKVNQILTFQSYNFIESSHVNSVVDSCKPIDYFRIYFDKTICQTIVDESNLYACQQNTQLGLHKEELDAFLGILIVIGFPH